MEFATLIPCRDFNGLAQLELHLEHGSLRFAFELDLPDVRSFRVDSFPHTIFYLIRGDHLDALRESVPQRRWRVSRMSLRDASSKGPMWDKTWDTFA